MLTRRRNNHGVSMIEVAMAIALLSLVAVFLLSSVTVLSRREMIRVDSRAKANSFATRYIEMERAQIRVSSLQGLLNTKTFTEKLEQIDYATSISYVQGRILLPGQTEVVDGVTCAEGQFVPTYRILGPGETLVINGVPKGPGDKVSWAYLTDDGSVAPNAAVKVAVNVAWSDQSLVREAIMVPRDN